MYPYLKPAYTVRRPTPDDIPAILTVMREYDIAETGEADAYYPDDIQSDWEHLDISTNAWVVIAPDGTLCGYATLTDESSGKGLFIADGYVHPSHLDKPKTNGSKNLIGK